MCTIILEVCPDSAGSRLHKGKDGSWVSLKVGPDHGPDISIQMSAGPQTLSFLQMLAEDVEEALAWAKDAMCDRCEEDVREPGSRYCRECQAEAYDEHLQDDNRERARDLRAERGAA
jgi:hypothetical protein